MRCGDGDRVDSGGAGGEGVVEYGGRVGVAAVGGAGTGDVFAALMEAVRTYSLGRISHVLYDAGGEYRRNM